MKDYPMNVFPHLNKEELMYRQAVLNDLRRFDNDIRTTQKVLLVSLFFNTIGFGSIFIMSAIGIL